MVVPPRRECGVLQLLFYATLNPCTPALLARAANRLQHRAKTTTSDNDIVQRHWFPLDFDPVRPADISSTDAEHEAALQRAAACSDSLQARGWPAPVAADSGNGGHLLCAIDLPNDAASRALLQRCLEALAMYFSDSVVALDLTVLNPARIWKVYGTMACKGDNLPDRPHRLARLLHVPTPVEVVTRAQLEALAALVPEPPQGVSHARHNGHARFDLDRWIAEHGLPVVARGPWNGGTRYVLNPCPWNGAHTNRSAFVVQFASGAIAAGCHHNGCRGHDWHALRDAYEPGWRAARDHPPQGRTTSAHAGMHLNTVSQNTRQRHNGRHPTTEGLTSFSSVAGAASADPHKIRPKGFTSLTSLTSYPEWPTLAGEAFYGLAGDLVHTIAPHSEADPVALLGQLLVYAGVIMGRSAYYQVEATRHYGNLDAVLVGATAKGRKGTAYDHIEHIMETVDTSWTLANRSGGCGSGEGLIAAVRDRTTKREPIKTRGRVTGYDEVEADPGVIDKRLLVYESEFASVLKIAGREGNILSVILRQAWETGNLRNTVKNNPLKATGAHIAVIGHITIEELQRTLTTTEAANGFGNRFLWLCVKRSKRLPDGGELHTVDFNPLLTRLREAVQQAKKIQLMRRDDAAKVAWHAVYPALSEDRPGLVGALLARAEAQVLRLSMLYALLDGTAIIKAEHLYAALAVWEYVEASAAYIFGDTLGDPIADTLIAALQDCSPQGLTRQQIIEETFNRNRRADEIDRVLRLLESRHLITLGKLPPEGGRGRPKEIVKYRSDEVNEVNEVNQAGYLSTAKDAVKSMRLTSSMPQRGYEVNPAGPSPCVHTRTKETADAVVCQDCGACVGEFA
jgi:hypothetical protein